MNYKCVYVSDIKYKDNVKINHKHDTCINKSITNFCSIFKTSITRIL